VNVEWFKWPRPMHYLKLLDCHKANLSEIANRNNAGGNRSSPRISYDHRPEAA
jgi:hypothetical protein